MNKTVIKCMGAILLCSALASCGSLYDKEPVGIGIDHSELKKSPCACLKLDLPRTLPNWFIS
ncbi:MAG: hypothetical protein EOM53_01310 [Alphaproteobacteria bacterium]|nr:hypothetical protein [Alphaproteobacteria bacterium]NCB49305.1 hypothetical protein [Alphaproteobacteria bacterium]